MRKKFHLWMPLFALFGLGLFAAFSIGENKGVSSSAQYPEIPKPDYSGLKQQGFDPLLEELLEKIREDYLELRMMDPQKYPWYQAHSSWSDFGPHTVIGNYILLLQKAGLNDEAKKILTLFPEPDDKRKLSKELWNKGEVQIYDTDSQNVRVYVALDFLSRGWHGDQRRNALNTAGTLYGMSPDKDGGMYVYSPRIPFYSSIRFYFPAHRTPKHREQTREFLSYFDWADYVMKTDYDPKIDVEIVDRYINNAKRNRDGGIDRLSIHTCRHYLELATLCHRLDRKDDVEMLLQLVEAVGIKSTKGVLRHQKKPVVEPVRITLPDYWNYLISFYLKTNQIDEAEKAFESMLENCGEQHKWRCADKFCEIYEFYCLEGWIDRAKKMAEKHSLGRILGQKNGGDRMSSLISKTTLLLDRRGQHEAATELSGKKPEERLEWIRQKVRRDPSLETLEILRLYLKQAGTKERVHVPAVRTERNELGILFWKLGDEENARLLFGLVDRQMAAERRGQTGGGFLSERAWEEAAFHADRYKAGFRDSLNDLKNRTLVLCRFLELTVETLEPEVARELFDFTVKSLDSVPITVEPYDDNIYRYDLLQYAAATALALGYFDEADKLLGWAREIEPKTLKTARSELAIVPPWDRCFNELMQRNPRAYKAAFKATNEMDSLIFRFGARNALAVMMLYEREP